MSGWRHIATAPDYERVLVWDGHTGRQCIAVKVQVRGEEGVTWHAEWDSAAPINPLKWMPIPAFGDNSDLTKGGDQ